MLQEVTSVLENLLPYIDTHSSLYKLINGFAVKGRQLMTTWSEVSPRLDSQDKTLRAQNVILLEQSKALTEASERIHELEERQEQLVQDTLKQTGRRGLRVLAIDDNPLALVMLTNVFEQYGHHVVGTSDPTKVIELALDNPPQLILCDLMQPELKDGIRIAYDIKHTATLSHIPLVALTALDLVILGTNEDFILSRSLFAGIVPKPETLNDFQLLIVNALSFIPLCEA
jgi:CheY-like chemotaxis protein